MQGFRHGTCCKLAMPGTRDFRSSKLLSAGALKSRHGITESRPNVERGMENTFMDDSDPQLLSRNSAPVDFDEILAKHVKTGLHKLNRGTARGVAVDAKKGIVTLRGEVPSFHIRQLLVHCCRRTPGVIEVIDELNVQVRNSPDARIRRAP